MPDRFVFDGPERAAARLILAHGAGQPMDSPFLAEMARRIAGGHLAIRVARFNFPYMARAVAEGRRRPPDRAAVLASAWHEAIAALPGAGPLFIGGKSLGGRVASMLADEAGVDGLVCLGYPFHPPGKAEKLRTAHLADLATPTLIVQGERDPFGKADEVPGYRLSPRIELCWMTDGDHGFTPRKASGRSLEDNLDAAAAAVVEFIAARCR